jgi:hypothetical protein
MNLFHHTISSLPWYLVRAFGLISVVLLVILIIFGIGMITGFTFRFWEPVKAWAIHKAIAIAFIFSLAGHIFFLLFDSFQRYTLKMIFIPFAGSIWLTFGILGMYLLIIITISSLIIIDTKKYLWKIIHLSSYLAIIFVFFHALNMGTDLKHGWLRISWIIIGFIIAIGIIMRLWRAGTIKNEK